jgi:ubiquinone/menaquinone biosynthesis C-methylase UbiE
MALDVEQFKQGQRAMWSAGDYADIATHIESAAEELVAACDVGPGQEVLDVATGSGNVAILAAQSGARVTGLDITPELFESARRRMAEAGVEVELIEGDAEALPFADASFDRVLSTFGVMFAPRHEQAAAELIRVCRPGGVIGIAAWTPEGATGQMFKTVSGHMPPPAPGFVPPVMWGTEDHVRSLFAASGAKLEFMRRHVAFMYDSARSWLEYNQRALGPMVMAKAALEPEGKWDVLHEQLIELYEGANEATDGSMHVNAEYLTSVARFPE